MKIVSHYCGLQIMLTIVRMSGIGYLNDQVRIICEGSLIGFSYGLRSGGIR
ncbi:hypothetical protein [Methanospirillum sp.]